MEQTPEENVEQEKKKKTGRKVDQKLRRRQEGEKLAGIIEKIIHKED